MVRWSMGRASVGLCVLVISFWSGLCALGDAPQASLFCLESRPQIRGLFDEGSGALSCFLDRSDAARARVWRAMESLGLEMLRGEQDPSNIRIHLKGKDFEVAVPLILFFGWFTAIESVLPEKYKTGICSSDAIKTESMIELSEPLVAAFRPVYEAFSFIERKVTSGSFNMSDVAPRLLEFATKSYTPGSELNDVITYGMHFLVSWYEFKMVYVGGASSGDDSKDAQLVSYKKALKKMQQQLYGELKKLGGMIGAVGFGGGSVAGFTQGLKAAFWDKVNDIAPVVIPTAAPSTTAVPSNKDTFDSASILQIVVAGMALMYCVYLAYKYVTTYRAYRIYKGQQRIELLPDEAESPVDVLVDVIKENVAIVLMGDEPSRGEIKPAGDANT